MANYGKHICIHPDHNHVCICMKQKDHAQNHDLPEYVQPALFVLVGEEMHTSPNF